MKPPIVILSAFATPFRSGAEACAEEIALRLGSGQAPSFDITIVTARLRRDLPAVDSLGGVPVIRVGIGSSIDKWLFPFLAPFAVRRQKPQIIHAVLETFAGLALHVCRWIVPSTKRILTLQTTNRSFLKGVIIRSSDRVTAISSALVKVAAELGRKDVALIPNGIHLKEIQEATKHHAKIPGRILYVGRLESMKGVDVLLRAFAKLKNITPITNANLRIVGDGSQRSHLETLAWELHLSDHVTFAGYIAPPDLYDEYASAEIFCGLSRSEALGNVFLEAQAAGCAVIATNVGGIPDIVEDGETGILVNPDDVEAVVEALKKLLQHEKNRAHLAAMGKKHAEQYDWKDIAERYAAAYDQLLR